LQTVPGIGEHLGLTILYEIGDLERFPFVKDFLSYCRLVKGTVASVARQSLTQVRFARSAKGAGPACRWAFGEAAVIAKRDHTIIGPLAQRLEVQFVGNKFKANTVLAIKLARAVYFMLKTKTVFDPEGLVAALSRKSFGPCRGQPARSNCRSTDALAPQTPSAALGTPAIRSH
jgi:hypothetical protein